MAGVVVDTSALICVLNEEADVLRVKSVLHAADVVYISAGTAFEASCVVRNERIHDGTARLNQLLAILDPELKCSMRRNCGPPEPPTCARPRLQTSGRLEHGRLLRLCAGKTRNLPLLFKGGDFIHADIVGAPPA